jgi:hypothetical protein
MPLTRSQLAEHVADVVGHEGERAFAVRSGVAPSTLWRIVNGRTNELIGRTAKKLADADSTWSLEDYHRFVPSEDIRKHRSELGFRAQWNKSSGRYRLVRASKGGKAIKGIQRTLVMKEKVRAAKTAWWAAKTPEERRAIVMKAVRKRERRRHPNKGGRPRKLDTEVSVRTLRRRAAESGLSRRPGRPRKPDKT